MSKPLTEEQKQLIAWGRWDLNDNITGPAAIDAALNRLDFLERKVQAAEVLANEVRDAYGLHAAQFVIAYDEVTDDDKEKT